ncbi:Spt20 family-domain-containing protein [Dendryphion nanum]|uniref:Spt20 family-domain-containing protein n=1 Tax=Dendryphion nanum TaxID=256645 RepID=A0A9P9IRG3_9PLEO|nr:Spt20 family-domain-containing protein [Dendryphion nanum]
MSAAVATARPSQALRQRRESQRPTLARTSTAKANTNPGNTDNMENGAAQGDNRPYVINQEYILRKFNGCPPSMRVYLHNNHVRVNDSTESFSYTSPIKELLNHIRLKTVPQNLLGEFYSTDLKFYDNCLIIEVHNLKSSGVNPKDSANSAAVTKGGDPFSIHNHNDYITPSPFVPFPQKSPAKGNGQTKGAEVKEEKEVDKENMPAPGQPASTQRMPARAKVITVVLFPTPQSHITDLQLLATTPMSDIQTYRRNQQAGRSQDNPPTPLTTVPPTPTLPVGRSPKRQKMVIDESNAYEFEAEMLLATTPKLYLEPTRSLQEAVALIDVMTHPNNKNPAPARKSRKRTTAELAADEADAADIQRYMLAGDEFQASKTGTAAGQEEGQAQLRSGGNFSRFKALENIKRHHEENERRKKEEEARQQQAKRQAHAELEAQKKREEAARQAEQTALMQQQRQEAMLRQREQQEQLRAAAHAQQMAAAAAAAQSTQTPQSATQPQFSSPVVRQGTPMAAAASPHLTTQPSHSLGGTPMVATSSNHGAGSPPRPPSAVSHPIVRTESQSRPSRTGTPQMIQGTPVMNAVPPRNISSTPQPQRMPQGSPTIPMQGGTPMMMMQSQPGQNMTPEQLHNMRAAQMGNNAIRMPQGMQMGQPTTQQLQQLAINKARQHIQQQGVPNGQNVNQYQQMLATQYYAQLQQQNQQRNQQHTGMPNMNPGQGMPGGNAGMPNQGAMNPSNMSYQQLKGAYIQRNQQLVQNYGSVQAAPPQHQQMMQSLQLAIRKKEAEMQQAQTAGAQVTGGMNPGMTAMGNMGQTPQQMQQWQAALTQQRLQQQHQQAQQARQQQLMMQQRQQLSANGNMMGNMGMMNPGQMNLNMQNMQNMGQMNMGNMQNMQAMQNMQGMQGMNMAQMSQQQIQMMLMRQQQQQQQQQMRAGQQQQQQHQQQRVPQGDGGIDWSGVSG